MARGPNISDVEYVPASQKDAREGLLGFISATLDGRLRLDGITLRLTLEGTITLSFPSRLDRYGIEHPYVQPLSDDARRELERLILGQLGINQEAGR